MTETTISKKKSKDSLNRRRLQKLMKNRLAMFGLFLFLAMILLCAAAPLLTSWDPNYP